MSFEMNISGNGNLLRSTILHPSLIHYYFSSNLRKQQQYYVMAMPTYLLANVLCKKDALGVESLVVGGRMHFRLSQNLSEFFQKRSDTLFFDTPPHQPPTIKIEPLHNTAYHKQPSIPSTSRLSRKSNQHSNILNRLHCSSLPDQT